MSRACHSRLSARRAGGRGFSLIEVLVSLIVIAIGMLGIAKLQAMAYASTGTASLRSLAAIQAASLAAAMHANRTYWTSVPTPLTIQVTGAAYPNPPVVTPAVGAPGCFTACSPASLANSDLATWANNINLVLPSVSGKVSCPTPIPVSGVTPPIGCTIQLQWTERSAGINAQSQGTTMTSPIYTLYVEP